MCNIDLETKIKNFLDDEGKIKQWPAKHQMKCDLLEYLSSKFESGREYSEKEVNAMIERWHTFGDYFLLRRGMVDAGCMERTRDGAKYWRAGK